MAPMNMMSPTILKLRPITVTFLWGNQDVISHHRRRYTLLLVVPAHAINVHLSDKLGHVFLRRLPGSDKVVAFAGVTPFGSVLPKTRPRCRKSRSMLTPLS
jgi:hypothetical protein